MKAWFAIGRMSAFLFLLLPAYGRTYKLRESVEVQTEVRLSDLLPPDASPVLQRASASIELCRPPQPGSVRVLSAEFLAAKLGGFAEIRQEISLPPEVIVRPVERRASGETIRDAIVRFVAQSGVNQVDLPPDVFWEKLQGPLMAELPTSFEVRDMRPNGMNTEMLAELRCVSPDACHEFLVQIPLRAQKNSAPRVGPTSENGTTNNLLVRSGTAAIAIFQTDGVKISQPVICLESGRLRQVIRVLNQKSHRIFFADVVAANLLAVQTKRLPTATQQP